MADEAIGHTAGNLIFTIETLPHPVFTRQGYQPLARAVVSTHEHADGHVGMHAVAVRCAVVDTRPSVRAEEELANRGRGVY